MWQFVKNFVLDDTDDEIKIDPEKEPASDKWEVGSLLDEPPFPDYIDDPPPDLKLDFFKVDGNSV